MALWLPALGLGLAACQSASPIPVGRPPPTFVEVCGPGASPAGLIEEPIYRPYFRSEGGPPPALREEDLRSAVAAGWVPALPAAYRFFRSSDGNSA